MFLEKDDRDENLKLVKPKSELRDLLLGSPMVVAYMTREKPNGQINGVNNCFFITYEPINASEHIYLNGLLQEYEEDYTVDKNCVLFNEPPQVGDKLVITYRFQV